MDLGGINSESGGKSMDLVAERLDQRLREWSPETAIRLARRIGAQRAESLNAIKQAIAWALEIDPSSITP